MADKLESYFKKHLSDDTPAEDNWNVPSDDVWNKVLPDIQKKRGLFIPWNYIYIIGAFILIGAAVILWPVLSTDTITIGEEPPVAENVETSTIDNSIGPDENNISLSEKDSLLNENDKQLIANNDLTNETIVPETDNNPESTKNNKLKKVKNTSPEGIDPSLNNNTQAAKDLNDVADESAFKQELQNTENENEAETKAITKTELPQNQSGISGAANETKASEVKSEEILIAENTEQDLSNEVGNKIIPAAAVNTVGDEGDEMAVSSNPQTDLNEMAVDTNAVEENLAAIKTIPAENHKKEIEAYNNKGKFGIGGFFAPTFNGTYINGNLNTGEIETSNMLLYSSNFGLEARYFISKRFSLTTGIEKSEIKSWSKSYVDFGYNTETEHMMPTGEKENTSPIPMPTPFGEINTEITYQFPGDQDIPNGELMNSSLETHQSIRYFAIPLGLEFNMLSFSHFNWYAEAGIRYNHAIRDATDFTSRVLHDGHDMDVVGEEMVSHASYTKNYLSFYAGTGLNYQFSESFQIMASGRYFGSISKVNLQDNLSTYVQGFSLKLGILYIF